MLSIKNIVKQYANHKALDNVSLEIKKGSIFGLLGPNGAGKTSLIRLITQITAPDEGEILFKGEKLNPTHIEKIGYLPEERGLYKKMGIGEQLLYLTRLKGLSRRDALQRIKLWFEKMEMESWQNKRLEDLSKGMQQKVQFVATVVHDPELIILDEPFSGFDPINAELIKNEIIDLNKKGTTIIFSTHRMESVEQLCDHIALIHQSHKILDGSVKSIKDSYRNNIFKIEYAGSRVTIHPDIFEVLNTVYFEDKTALTIKLRDDKTANDALACLIPQVHLLELTELIPSIHEIFIDKVKSTI